VRRPSKQRSPRSRERSRPRASRTKRAKRGRALAPRLAKLLARERRHTQQLAAIRSRIDATLCGSSISEYKAIAHDIILALGLNDTANELERVAAALKTRAVTARRRCRSAGRAASRQAVVEAVPTAQHDDMTNPPLRKREIIEYYGPSDGDLGAPEDLNGDFEDDDADEDPADHDLGDSDQRGPGPR
jgi:hypothetical protein